MLRIPPELLFSGLGGLLGGSLDDFLDRLLDNLGLGRSDLVVRAADEQLHRRLDVAVQRDGHLVLAGRLDGVAQLDAATIDVDVRRGLDGIGDHLSGNGTEQLTLFAHLGFDLDERAVERFLDLAGVGKAVLFALGDVVLALLELLQVALRSEDGNLLREQVVVGKTGATSTTSPSPPLPFNSWSRMTFMVPPCA